MSLSNSQIVILIRNFLGQKPNQKGCDVRKKKDDVIQNKNNK